MSARREGFCASCRHHVNYCKLNVVDRQRGRNAEPCGWWKPKRRKKETPDDRR